MMLTTHFALAEFACRDGTRVPDELIPAVHRLAAQLEVLRQVVGKPIVVLSGYRTPAWNTHINAVAKSQHMLGTAADIRVYGVTPAMVHGMIEHLAQVGEMHDGGLGLYTANEKRRAGWVHYDVRPKRARWRG